MTLSRLPRNSLQAEKTENLTWLEFSSFSKTDENKRFLVSFGLVWGASGMLEIPRTRTVSFVVVLANVAACMIDGCVCLKAACGERAGWRKQAEGG